MPVTFFEGVRMQNLVPFLSVFMMAPAFASKLNVQYKYSEKGVEFCAGEKEMKSKETYVLCEGQMGADRLVVKGRLSGVKQEAATVTAEIERIDPAGRIKTISRPKVRLNLGEPASVAQGNDRGEEQFKLEVTATKN